MHVFSDIKSIQEHLAKSHSDFKIGFVPTMGALHQGHLSLINQAQKANDIIVVSIFVNPTQFDNLADLDNYPRTLDTDLELLNKVNCDIVFTPTVSEMYQPNEQKIHFDFDGIEYEMEGKYRVGHFDGVGTIVKKLFEIIKPSNAYFGEKDFQQLQIVKKLVEILKLPIKIVPCAIYREDDGLAMSSRNMRLNKNQRQAAPLIYKTLNSAKEKFGTISVDKLKQWVDTQFANHPFLTLEYFEIASEQSLKPYEVCQENEPFRAFIAVYADDIRLIDNISLGN